MLAFRISNLLALRQEVTVNLHQITIEEDNIAIQLRAVVPNIHIICASLNSIVNLKARNANILAYLNTVAG